MGQVGDLVFRNTYPMLSCFQFQRHSCSHLNRHRIIGVDLLYNMVILRLIGRMESIFWKRWVNCGVPALRVE